MSSASQKHRANMRAFFPFPARFLSEHSFDSGNSYGKKSRGDYGLQE
jgi:hypothetical protein